MDINAYHSYEEPRTASAQTRGIKSIQSWKSRKTPAQSEIIADLNKAGEARTASFDKTLMGYAPQKIPTDATNTPETFQFGDVIDIVNPLQHLPIIGTAYRGLTGDDLSPMSGIIGGALYGGPIGAITGTANAISKIQTGKDIGQHALDLVTPSKPTTQNGQHKIAEVEKTINDTTYDTAQKIEIQKDYTEDITTLTLAAMPPRQPYP